MVSTSDATTIRQVYNIMTYIHMDNVRQEMDFGSRGMQEGSEGGVREEWKEGVAMVYFTVKSELASLLKKTLPCP